MTTKIIYRTERKIDTGKQV